MSAGITIDVREFQAAFRDYLVYTSKTLKDAINGKTKDILLRSAKYTPSSKVTTKDVRAQAEAPEIVTHRANRKYGAGKWTRDQWSEIRESMRKRTAGKGFMKSAFVKAANVFRATGDASKERAARLEQRFTKSKGEAKQATEKTLTALFNLEWSARDAQDQAGKTAIVSQPIAAAVAWVTQDMRAYITRKLDKQAKKIGATAARSVGKLFRAA